MSESGIQVTSAEQVERSYDTQFLRYVASCGAPFILRDGHAAIVSGLELTLDQIRPPRLHYNRKLSPLVISLYEVETGKMTADLEDEEKLFKGIVRRSPFSAISIGDDLIGLASPECPTSIVNTSDPEDMKHFSNTYRDLQDRALILL